MSISIKQRRRDKRFREKGKLIVICCEGNNKSEKLYFNNFKTRRKNIKFCTGNNTDPKGMVESLIQYIKLQDVNIKEGDKAYCVFDGDVDNSKQYQIYEARLLAKKYGIEIIMSVPSFEIWYLLHFKYTTKSFSSNNELIKELKKYITNYNKNSNVYDFLKARIDFAIKNAKRLKKYHLLSEGQVIDNLKFNPCTDIYIIVEYILNI